jgi:hypothetical protein
MLDYISQSPKYICATDNFVFNLPNLSLHCYQNLWETTEHNLGRTLSRMKQPLILTHLFPPRVESVNLLLKEASFLSTIAVNALNYPVADHMKQEKVQLAATSTTASATMIAT